MKKIQNIWQITKESITRNFKSATIGFTVIIIFINMYQMVFGSENMVLGIILAPLILILMTRDLTARPVKHSFTQAFVLCSMAAMACLQSIMPVPAAAFINFAMIYALAYGFTSECGDHLYFQYILSYLFLIFLGPITPEQLPTRLIGMIVGSACIVIYQCYKGKNRFSKITQTTLLSMLDQGEETLQYLLSGQTPPQNPRQLRSDLNDLSKIIDERKKKLLCISDASLATLEAGRDLEGLVLLLYQTKIPSTPEDTQVLQKISGQLSVFRSYILQERTDIPALERTARRGSESIEAEQLYHHITHIRKQMLEMNREENRQSFSKTSLSFRDHLKGRLKISPVRFVYALRVSCLLAVGILFVQHFALPHGKWLLFTIASVSLPYADDVGAKAKKRLAATLMGGLFALAVFTLIPSPVGRTIVMMLSGYASFYLPSYVGNFSCATVGALGGAILSSAIGFNAVGGILLIRLSYILLGIVIALIGNCFILPFKRERATRHLSIKYVTVTRSIAAVCQQEQFDRQLYYNLLIRMHLLEDKLRQNANTLRWDGINDFLEQHQGRLWKAAKGPKNHAV